MADPSRKRDLGRSIKWGKPTGFFLDAVNPGDFMPTGVSGPKAIQPNISGVAGELNWHGSSRTLSWGSDPVRYMNGVQPAQTLYLSKAVIYEVQGVSDAQVYRAGLDSSYDIVGACYVGSTLCVLLISGSDGDTYTFTYHFVGYGGAEGPMLVGSGTFSVPGISLVPGTGIGAPPNPAEYGDEIYYIQQPIYCSKDGTKAVTVFRSERTDVDTDLQTYDSYRESKVVEFAIDFNSHTVSDGSLTLSSTYPQVSTVQTPNTPTDWVKIPPGDTVGDPPDEEVLIQGNANIIYLDGVPFTDYKLRWGNYTTHNDFSDTSTCTQVGAFVYLGADYAGNTLSTYKLKVDACSHSENGSGTKQGTGLGWFHKDTDVPAPLDHPAWALTPGPLTSWEYWTGTGTDYKPLHQVITDYLPPATDSRSSVISTVVNISYHLGPSKVHESNITYTGVTTASVKAMNPIGMDIRTGFYAGGEVSFYYDSNGDARSLSARLLAEVGDMTAINKNFVGFPVAEDINNSHFRLPSFSAHNGRLEGNPPWMEPALPSKDRFLGGTQTDRYGNTLVSIAHIAYTNSFRTTEESREPHTVILDSSGADHSGSIEGEIAFPSSIYLENMSTV